MARKYDHLGHILQDMLYKRLEERIGQNPPIITTTPTLKPGVDADLHLGMPLSASYPQWSASSSTVVDDLVSAMAAFTKPAFHLVARSEQEAEKAQEAFRREGFYSGAFRVVINDAVPEGRVLVFKQVTDEEVRQRLAFMQPGEYAVQDLDEPVDLEGDLWDQMT